jgi:ATP-dependent NAD(P)H-hydrate dehydratase
MLCNASGGAKRCGGQGHVLVGCIATFISWALAFLDAARASSEGVLLPELNPMVLAAYGACLVTRTSALYAFAARKRSMVASDLLRQLGPALDMLFAESSAPLLQGGGGGSA